MCKERGVKVVIFDGFACGVEFEFYTIWGGDGSAGGGLEKKDVI